MRTAAIALALLAAGARAQSPAYTQRGYVETQGVFYPQAAPGDSSAAVGEALLHYEGFYKPAAGLRLAGAIEARTDTHRQDERAWGLGWQDRERLRPALAVRRLSATWNRGRFTFEVGKQLIRWGKADVLTPTDRFAPRDYVNVVNTEFLGITAARVTYGTASDTIDLVWAPRFTPSRIPLVGQRWASLPAEVTLVERAPRFPGGSQAGARWNHVGRAAEYSLSFYDGFNHLPLFRAEVEPAALRVIFERYYPRMRMYGADIAVPARAVTVKAEAGYFTSATPTADEYLLWVVQLERQAGEWFFIGGYAGQKVTERRSTVDFAPDRGFAKAVVARAGYTIDVNRSLALETVIRQNGDGLWTKFEYTQAFGQHWRATAGFALIRGAQSDFLGQYRRNSHGILALRYSF
jgi:hypothetical protein